MLIKGVLGQGVRIMDDERYEQNLNRNAFRIIYDKLDMLGQIIYFTTLMTSAIIIVSMAVTGLLTGKPTVMGGRPYFIMSASMEPVIHTHQFVWAIPIEAEDVEIGDIVAYSIDGRMVNTHTVIHRVIDENEDGYILKGDNNMEPDSEIVTDEMIQYKIVNY